MYQNTDRVPRVPRIWGPGIKIANPQKSRKMSQSRLTLQQFLILAFVSVSVPTGDACLSRGMSALPPISLGHPLSLIGAVFTPWIALGIALLIGYFASYLTALSWADLTYVMPATAMGNVIIVLLAQFWLHEAISWQRWLGVFLITVGVGFVAQGPVSTTPPATSTGAEEAQ
jgi:drug/metabolite transporter (DMT)-like permease